MYSACFLLQTKIFIGNSRSCLSFLSSVLNNYKRKTSSSHSFVDDEQPMFCLAWDYFPFIVCLRVKYKMFLRNSRKLRLCVANP